jgi:hypothetical protein
LPRSPHSTFEGRILDELKSLNLKLEESIRLGTENGAEIRSLRKELGMEGLHGRLPTIEAAIARMDRTQEDDHKAVLQRLDRLEAEAYEESGRRGLKHLWVTVATSSAAASLIAALAKLLGFIH